jgi:hypothetical protein
MRFDFIGLHLTPQAIHFLKYTPKVYELRHVESAIKSGPGMRRGILKATGSRTVYFGMRAKPPPSDMQSVIAGVKGCRVAVLDLNGKTVRIAGIPPVDFVY